MKIDIPAVENFFTSIGCIDGPKGNLTVSMIGIPREWTIMIATVGKNNETEWLEGKGSTLFNAMQDLLNKR